jgi:SpoVK/Ycf46/Vps4 family AAA+-type ATPase
MDNVLAKAAVRQRGFDAGTVRLVLEEKRTLIRRTGALSFTPAIPIEHIGGYAPIRRLLRRAALTFSPEAREFGVEDAKGLLLVGLPGCGKDTLKKAASSVLGRALLDLDLGAAMGEGGGLIGSAELSIKRALQIATTAKCVLGIGEFEKAVGGMQSSARTDGGATSRVVGSLLNWLAEPHPGVFVIATANDVRELAPEQVREGRFTPVLWISLRGTTAPRSSLFICGSAAAIHPTLTWSRSPIGRTATPAQKSRALSRRHCWRRSRTDSARCAPRT